MRCLHLLCTSQSLHPTRTVPSKPCLTAKPCLLSWTVAPQVEWTRELHDKFVSAVEALSVDKAVPSKILERMGTCSEGLTRQNIASHLQKYRNRSALPLFSQTLLSLSLYHSSTYRFDFSSGIAFIPFVMLDVLPHCAETPLQPSFFAPCC